MRKILLFVGFCVAAGAAQAQIKCWNEGGKRVCGDAPPAGAKVTTLNTPSGPSAPAPVPGAKDGAKDGAKAASKGPLTPAEREQDYRKRQAESAKAAEKSAQAEREAAAKKDTCDRARAALSQLESGQRIALTDAKGERYFMDDNQKAAEIAKARQVVQDACSN